MERYEEDSCQSNVMTAKRRRISSSSSNIYIPDDIVSQILIRLPAKSIVRFRSVCKSWCSLSSTPLFVEGHADRARTKIICQPQHYNYLETQFSLYEIDDDHMIKEIPIVIPTKIVDECRSYFGISFHNLCLLGSCDGLLFFQESYGMTYHVLNIATKEWLAIPEPRGREIHQKIVAAFYFHRSTGEYRLLSLYLEGMRFGFEVFSLGRESTSWRQILESEFSYSAYSNLIYQLEPMCIQAQVIIHGHVHWPPCADNWLIAFDVESERLRKILLPQPLQNGDGEYECELIDMGGSLGLCQITSTVMEIWLLKDYAKEEWVKQHTILTNNFVRPPKAETFRPLALWSNDAEILMKWNDNDDNDDNDVLFLYNLKSKLSRYVTPIDFYTCDRHCHCHCLCSDPEFRVALSKETLRGHKNISILHDSP